MLAHLGQPDMRVPIQYALSYRALGESRPRLIGGSRSLTFETRTHRTSLPGIGSGCRAVGGTLPAVLSGADEASGGTFPSGSD